MYPRNTLTEYARLFISTLVRQGVREAIISPGSRSTPLVFAALRHPGLICRSIVDERCAAFFALGRSKMTGRSPVLICTSGSAGAHYYPAVLEAEAACVPLIIVTADRPLFLAHSNAHQTTDQQHLFGNHVRFFADCVPQPEERVLRALKHHVALAIEKAHFVHPGPVHLNFHADKPLEPFTGELQTREKKLVEQARKIDKEDFHVSISQNGGALRQEEIEAARVFLRESKRGLITLGPILPCHQVSADTIQLLAEKTGFLVLAESTSQFRFQKEYKNKLFFQEQLLLLGKELPLPDCILHLGFPPTSMPANKLLEQHPDITRIVFCEGEWGDPYHSARMIFHGDMEKNLKQLERSLTPNKNQDKKWYTTLISLAQSYGKKLKAALEENDLTSGFVLQCIGRHLKKDRVLVLGNSLSVRKADTFIPLLGQNSLVWCQRGLNGIDGLVSGAIGAISSSLEGGIAVLGDVSSLHDIGGFALGKFVDRPCVLLILNNQGGKIFDLLPAAKNWTEKESDFWTTPHQKNFSHIAAMFDMPYFCATNKKQIDKGLQWGIEQQRAVIVEAIITEMDTASIFLQLKNEAAHLSGTWKK